jgi:PPOX class probable F420-dependent enzyme
VAQLTEKQKEFLANPFIGVTTTLRSDGSPHATPVWVDSEDGGLMFNTARGRAKERHLSKDPRVSVTVVDPGNAYRWLSVSGRAELTEEGADADIDRLAKKYLGKDEYPWRSATATRVTVKITPQKIDSTGIEE